MEIFENFLLLSELLELCVVDIMFFCKVLSVFVVIIQILMSYREFIFDFINRVSEVLGFWLNGLHVFAYSKIEFQLFFLGYLSDVVLQ